MLFFLFRSLRDDAEKGAFTKINNSILGESEAVFSLSMRQSSRKARHTLWGGEKLSREICMGSLPETISLRLYCDKLGDL
jgi:hypothetical protein